MIIRILPPSNSPHGLMIKGVNALTKHKNFFVRHCISRVVSIVALEILTVPSFVYHAGSFALKTPLTLYRYTFGWIGGHGKHLKGCDIKSMSVHLLGLVVMIHELVTNPLLSLVNPKWVVNYHVFWGLGEINKKTVTESQPIQPRPLPPLPSTPLVGGRTPPPIPPRREPVTVSSAPPPPIPPHREPKPTPIPRPVDATRKDISAEDLFKGRGKLKPTPVKKEIVEDMGAFAAIAPKFDKIKANLLEDADEDIREGADDTEWVEDSLDDAVVVTEPRPRPRPLPPLPLPQVPEGKDQGKRERQKGKLVAERRRKFEQKDEQPMQPPPVEVEEPVKRKPDPKEGVKIPRGQRRMLEQLLGLGGPRQEVSGAVTGRVIY